jgi:site-specific recombinase XerD
MNIDDILARFREHQVALNRSPSTIQWYGTMLRRFVAFMEGQEIKTLCEVDEKLIIQYQYLMATKHNHRGQLYCIPCQNFHFAAVRNLFEYLRMTGEVRSNPTAFVEQPKQVRALPKQPLSVEEMDLLLSQPDRKTVLGCRDLAIMELLYSSGLRRMEILQLDIKNICFETRTARVKGKGSRERVVPFGRLCADALVRYLDFVRPGIAAEGSGDAVFLMIRSGTRLGTQGIKGLINKYAAMAGLKRTVTPHIFRHSCATHLIDGGADVRHVQELLGHACLSTTALYCHITIGRLKKVHAACHPREHAA